MKIDKALNLVLAVDRDGFTIHVHSSPISEEVFENYYLPISKTFAGIYDEGVALAAPRIAGMMLKDVSKRLGLWEGEEGVQAGLMKEIERLTNVLVPGDNGGFVSMPLESAMARDKISPEEYREIFGQIIFFYCDLCNAQKETDPAIPGSNDKYVGWGDHIVKLYGVRRLFDDIDRGREYWREGRGSIINSVLDYITSEGFGAYFGRHDSSFRTAHEFRQRHLIKAIEGKKGI